MKKRKSPYLRSLGWGMFLAGALMLCSCSSDEMLDQQGLEQEVAIEFGKLKTRAAVNSATDIREFGVFADMNTIPDNGYVSLLENEKVYRADNADNAPFIYDNKRYWINGHTFRFFAVYPYNANAVQATTLVQNGTEYKGYQISFVTPETADTDFMTASDTKNIAANATTYNAVDLNFSHALSKINIKVSNSANPNAKIILKSISLSGFSKDGNYNFSLDANYINHWEINSQAGTMSITKTPDIEGLWTITDGGNLETMGDGLLLVPQQIINGKVKVKIIYDYYQFEDSEEAEETNASAEANLPVGNWQEGQHYTYNIMLAAKTNEIYFITPTVEQWFGPASGGTVIIQ